MTVTETGTARVAAMAERYAQGATLRQIGSEFGISGERVRQVLRGHGIGPQDQGTTARRAAKRAREAADAAAAERAAAWLAEHGPATKSALAAAVPEAATRATAWIADGLVPDGLLIPDAKRVGASLRDGWDFASAAAAVRAVWEAAGRPVGPRGGFTGAMYDEALHGCGLDAPARSTIAVRWSWREVCEEAGVPVPATAPREYRARFGSPESVLVWVSEWLAVCAETGGLLSFNEYERWARGTAGAPSGASVRNAMRRSGVGLWEDVVKSAADHR